MNKEILEYCKKKKRSIREIMEKFNIPESRMQTLRNRLKENNVDIKDCRGRKRIDL